MSRNDLFTTSWSVPPPKPLTISTSAPIASSPCTPIKSSTTTNNHSFASGSSTIPRAFTNTNTKHHEGSLAGDEHRHPHTSLRYSTSTGSALDASRRRSRPPPIEIRDDTPLSPLHQSPSLAPIDAWKPPLPPFEDVDVRLIPSDSYLLGEGRYGRVYLASFRRSGGKGKGKERERGSLSGSGTVRAEPGLGMDGDANTSRVAPAEQEASGVGLAVREEVNDAADGFVGGSWKLCAAKRMAPDRQSQTMGLREAFFLNRLKVGPTPAAGNSTACTLGTTSNTTTTSSSGNSISNVIMSHTGTVATSTSTSTSQPGQVFIVRLYAVKEDVERRHARSVSDVTQSKDDISSFPIHPSSSLSSSSLKLNSSLSRLTLLLEHAPLGTLDRLLRTSPSLVTREMWSKWANQSSTALSWIHSKGVVHADVKPANLLLTSTLDLRLSDFGSSLLVHSNQPPIDGVGLGTLPFSAPELIDPNRSFSFPVDVFALGASLYQCISGKEPYRGLRAVEMMHHVKKGGLWGYEERQRLNADSDFGPAGSGSVYGSGSYTPNSTTLSPYPSAWREEPLRRGGSLRVRPRLSRMPSAESLRASDDALAASSNESPSGIKLWARWANQPQPGADAVSALLAEDDVQQQQQPTKGKIGLASAPRTPEQISPVSPASSTRYGGPGDGTVNNGVMVFLGKGPDGPEEVSEDIRGVLREMLSADPLDRPTAEELKDLWKKLLV